MEFQSQASVKSTFFHHPALCGPAFREKAMLHSIRTSAVCITFLTLAFLAPLSARPESATAYEDSLRAAMDSVSRRADSLSRAVDSLTARLASPAPKAPPPAAAAPEKEPWEMGLGLGYTLNRGNSKQTAFISSLNLSRTGERTRFNNDASFTSASIDSGRKTRKAALKSKFELKHSERFFYFTTLDLDHNREAGLDLRMAPGLGAGFVLLTGKKVSLNFNLGANPITEYISGQPRKTRGHYLGIQELKVRFNSRTRLEQSLTYKPRFDKTEDYLLNFNLSLNNELTSSFSLKVNLEGKYNSRPPLHDPVYKRSDWMFYTAVSYSIW